MANLRVMTGGRHATIGTGGRIACLLALLWALLVAAPAHAAPQYEDSEPSDGASLQSAPPTVSISFSVGQIRSVILSEIGCRSA